MGRPKKNGTYLNVCVDTIIYEELDKFCKESGQTKTTAVQRALEAYIKAYKEQQEILKTINEKKGK